MSYIVLMRNPRGGVGSLMTITSEDDFENQIIAEFDSYDEADECASTQMLCEAWGYQIVEVDV